MSESRQRVIVNRVSIQVANAKLKLTKLHSIRNLKQTSSRALNGALTPLTCTLQTDTYVQLIFNHIIPESRIMMWDTQLSIAIIFFTSYRPPPPRNKLSCIEFN